MDEEKIAELFHVEPQQRMKDIQNLSKLMADESDKFKKCLQNLRQALEERSPT